MGRARRVLFITGAGISAESGLPTYRGIGGLYNAKQTEENIPIEEALSGSMLLSRPEITWKYISQIEKSSRGAGPNRAHDTIARLEARPGTPEVCVLTQNVDGLHQAAGSRNIIAIHGDVHFLHCTRCVWEDTVDDYSALEMPPRCPECQSLVRPRVVLFGEILPMDAVTRLEDELSRGFDIVFSVGTTSVFPYIAAPVVSQARAGGTTVEINPAESAVSDFVRYRFRHPAGQVLADLWRAMESSGNAGEKKTGERME